MNEENWVEIETTEMRKNVKKKDEEENWRIGKRTLNRKWKKKEKRNEKQQQEKRRKLSRHIEENHNGVTLWKFVTGNGTEKSQLLWNSILQKEMLHWKFFSAI